VPLGQGVETLDAPVASLAFPVTTLSGSSLPHDAHVVTARPRAKRHVLLSVWRDAPGVTRDTQGSRRFTTDSPTDGPAKMLSASVERAFTPSLTLSLLEA
jgi:hypothetical protein